MKPARSHNPNNRDLRLTTLFSLLVAVMLTASACSGGETEQIDDEMMDEMTGQMDHMTDESSETTLTASLSGSTETDEDGSGMATVTFDAGSAEVCYEITYENIEEPTVAHIHRGAEGESGGVAVNFNVPENSWDGCLEGVDQAVINEILNAPENFYVNVHNGPFPGGVIRGQLMAEM